MRWVLGHLAYSDSYHIKRSSLKLLILGAVLVIFAVFCPRGEVHLGRRGGGCHVTEGGLCHVTERGLVIVFVRAVGARRQVIILLFRVLKGLISAKYKRALQLKSHLGIPFLEIARPQSQFPHSPHSCVCDRSTCLTAAK